MRIHGRLSNPLLRRVQRHARVSTLFHAPGGEIAPDESRNAPLRVRPVQASLLLPEPEVAPPAADTPLGELSVVRPAPQTVPVQTFPAPSRLPTVAVSPAASPVSQMQPAAIPPAAAPEADSAKAEEDRNWKRLQTIMRKHEEKQLTEQATTETAPQPSEPLPVAGQPQPMVEGKTPPEHTITPSAAPVQRRANVVEELPVAAAGQPAPSGISDASQQPAQAKALPPLVEFSAARPGPSQAEKYPAEVGRQPESAPIPPAAEPVHPVQRAVEPQKPPLTPAAPPEEPLPTREEAPAAPERIQRWPAPQGQPERPEPRNTPPSASQVEIPTPPLQPEGVAARPASAEAPTLRVPRATLGLEQAQPVQPSELPRRFEQETPTVIAGPEMSPLPNGQPGEPQELPTVIAEPEEPPQSHELHGEPAAAVSQPGVPVVQRQIDRDAKVVERPGVQAPPAAADQSVAQVPQAVPDRPVVHIPQETPDRQLVETPPPLVKASLGAAPAIQLAPESSTILPQAVPVPQPTARAVDRQPGPAAAEPLASHFEPLSDVPNAPSPAASLEAVWPVQRMPDTAIPPKPAPPVLPAAGGVPEVLPHNAHVGQILQSVAPGLPSDSLVELVTPRKPRPASARKETPPVQPQESPDVPQPAPQTESATVIAPPPGETLQRAAAPIQPEVKQVQTEIGPLPSDLWGLIGQPQPETAPPSEPPAQAHPVRQSALQRHIAENEPVQREPVRPAASPEIPQAPSPEGQSSAESPEALEEEVSAPEAEEYYYEAMLYPSGTADLDEPANVVQRAVSVDEITTEVVPPSSGEQQASASPNVEELAQRVYKEIRRRLSVEFERWRRSG